MKTITAEQLQLVMSGIAHTRLIDVQPERDFDESHIEGAENIPHNAEDFVSRVDAITDDRTHSVILYCDSGDCNASMMTARRLMNAGFTHIYDFEGGLAEWQRVGLPVVEHAHA